LKVHLHHFSKVKSPKEKSQNSRNQVFIYYFCLLIEKSMPLTNGSGSERPTDPEHCFIVPALQFTGPAFLLGNMKGSELLIDPDTGEVNTLPMAGAEDEGEEQRLEASCVRLRLFCPNKFPGMSVGKCV
jgi:hypothetical protein